MRRRGVVQVLAVASFVLVLGSLATKDGGHGARPVAAPAPNPVGAGSHGPDRTPADDARPPADPRSQPARPRPPTDIPRLPISFVQRPRPAGAVALTIDDGPSPVWTPPVLDLLARYHVHATFCLIGEQVQKYPDLVRRIAAGGHTLCDHTWDHDELLPSRSAQVIDSEIQSTFDAIVRASGGVRPVYYRAPGGNWGDGQVTGEARRLGMTSLNWSVDPVDWSRPGTQKIISVVLGSTEPGDVILMHDGGGNRQQSLDALRVILPTLLARGDTFVTP
ncbi:MAG TPA: polysaccharide deacetylase family protein [Mycobacteriales bacterium]|nr:polysaccharide deacetylase family protein [Mycobacteriales bacterium]